MDATSVPKEYLVLGGGGLFISMICSGVGAGNLCSMAAFFFYPAFKSLETMETKTKGDVIQWLVYWVVFSFFSLIETFSGFLLYWIPFYYAFKLVFLLWTMLPQTRGSKFLYDFFVSVSTSKDASGGNEMGTNEEVPASTAKESQPKSSTNLFSSGTYKPASFASKPPWKTVGAGVKINLSPLPTSKDASGGDETGTNDEVPTVLESADDDWKEEMQVKINAFHFRKENKPTKFATGTLKIQSSKETPTVCRMVLRDLAGKVLINLGISKGMAFSKEIVASKGAHKNTGSICFFRLMEGREPERFVFSCSPENLDEFHSTLLRLAG